MKATTAQKKERGTAGIAESRPGDWQVFPTTSSSPPRRLVSCEVDRTVVLYVVHAPKHTNPTHLFLAVSSFPCKVITEFRHLTR